VKRGKTDVADAEAICGAQRRPSEVGLLPDWPNVADDGRSRCFAIGAQGAPAPAASA